MEKRGRTGTVETECDRDNHDYRLFDYNPATAICLNCGIIRGLSKLTNKQIETVKMLESGEIKDIYYPDYIEGPNGYPIAVDNQTIRS